MKHRAPTIAGAAGAAFLLLLSAYSAAAQVTTPTSQNTTTTTPNGTKNPYGFSPNFNPSMAIIIVVLIAAFFFLGFFSIYIRQCGGVDAVPSTLAAAAAAPARSRGVDPDLLATFPTLVYSEVKSLKIGKGALECAVCLSEFEDSDALRLLPRCSHVFHPDCIDEWLGSHVTCPVCRSDLHDITPAESAAAVTINIEERKIEDLKADLAELDRIASRRRGSAAPIRIPRSHSTGHSLALEHDHDRFTLRLPEDVRRNIVAASRMRRGESLHGYRAGAASGVLGAEGSSRGRSIRLGRSGRWASFKNLSMKVPAWAARRWDGEGSTKKGEGSMKKGEGSMKNDGDPSPRGRMRVQFDSCLGGGAAATTGSTDDEIGRV